MRRDYMISNADIIRSLLHSGYAHNCARCERGMHVRQESGLCVWCYNGEERAPQLTRSVESRAALEVASAQA